MGHGKETPRQKMIGMMYLVLTAMLALNVSKDVLNAFAYIDHGIVKSVENTVKKNEDIYSKFETRKLSAPSPVVDLYHKHAMEIKKKSDEICEYIFDSKKEIVKKVDGSRSEDPEKGAITEHHIDVIKINGKDKTDIPALVMVGEGGGNGFKLKKMIDELREFTFSLIKDEGESNKHLREAIFEAINTEKIKHADQYYDWVRGNFEHIPTAGVIAILSGIENAVRNVEMDVINYLYQQIDEGSIKFNLVEAMVHQNSNFVIKGNDYQAEIFIAASDTSSKPMILIGDYKEIKNEAGVVTDYEMTGRVDSVNIVQGKGQYVIPTGSLNGEQKYKGIIFIKKPDGTTTKRPFESSFTVSPPQAVVSPTKMNVFYLGLENPVDISVAGVPQNKVSASISNGSISKTRDGWVVKPSKPGTSQITVIAEIDGQKKRMGTKDFRVKIVPDPVPKVAGKTGGSIVKSVLAAQKIVTASLDDFLFDLTFDVVSFSIYTVDKGFVREEVSKSKSITPQQTQLLQSLQPNQRVVFENIKVKKPGGIIVDVPSVSFKVQ